MRMGLLLILLVIAVLAAVSAILRSKKDKRPRGFDVLPPEDKREQK